jgi:hypothetical protein
MLVTKQFNYLHQNGAFQNILYFIQIVLKMLKVYMLTLIASVWLRGSIYVLFNLYNEEIHGMF